MSKYTVEIYDRNECYIYIEAVVNWDVAGSVYAIFQLEDKSTKMIPHTNIRRLIIKPQ